MVCGGLEVKRVGQMPESGGLAVCQIRGGGSSNLVDPWSTSTASPTITPIDDTWERVLIEDDQPSATKRFARVKVSYTQP
jgi:hypothetical protein